MDLFNKLESIVQYIYTSSQESNSIVCKYCINRDTSNVSFAETLLMNSGKASLLGLRPGLARAAASTASEQTTTNCTSLRALQASRWACLAAQISL